MAAAAVPIAVGASVGGLALGVGSDLMKAEAAGAEGYKSIAQGKAALARAQGTQASNEFQAARAERAARFGKVQADLTDTVYREELNTTLRNIDVIRAAARIDPTSPTSAVIATRERELSDRQRQAAALTARSQIAEEEEGARFLREAGRQAVLMGEYEKKVGEYGGELAQYNKKTQQVGAFAKLLGGIGKAFA